MDLCSDPFARPVTGSQPVYFRQQQQPRIRKGPMSIGPNCVAVTISGQIVRIAPSRNQFSKN